MVCDCQPVVCECQPVVCDCPPVVCDCPGENMVCNASRVCVCEDGFILSVSGVYCNRIATDPGIYVKLCVAQYIVVIAPL